MGTRSAIGVMHGDKAKVVYCHNDGYLSYNGQILQEHYNSARANNLVALGVVGEKFKGVVEQTPLFLIEHFLALFHLNRRLLLLLPLLPLLFLLLLLFLHRHQVLAQ